MPQGPIEGVHQGIPSESILVNADTPEDDLHGQNLHHGMSQPGSRHTCQTHVDYRTHSLCDCDVHEDASRLYAALDDTMALWWEHTTLAAQELAGAKDLVH